MTEEQQPDNQDESGEGPGTEPVLPYSCLNSEALPEADRFDAVSDSVRSLYRLEAKRNSERRRFRATLEGYHLGSLVFGHTTMESTGFQLSRDRRYRSAFDSDPLQLFVYRQGGYHGRNGGRSVALRPGDVGILDLGRDLYIHHAERSDHLTLVIPRDVLLDKVSDSSALEGAILPRERALTQLLANHLNTVHRVLPGAKREEVATIRGGVLDLIAATFGPAKAAAEQAEAAVGRATLDAILSYIECRLQSPELTPERLCRRFNCSRAYLYRLFKPLGGVHHYIQERRLRRCFQLLGDSTHREERVIDIAFRYGFSNQSHFSRLFRKQFGMSPSEARAYAYAPSELARDGTLELASGKTPAFAQWLTEV